MPDPALIVQIINSYMDNVFLFIPVNMSILLAWILLYLANLSYSLLDNTFMFSTFSVRYRCASYFFLTKFRDLLYIIIT